VKNDAKSRKDGRKGPTQPKQRMTIFTENFQAAKFKGLATLIGHQIPQTYAPKMFRGSRTASPKK